MRAWFGRLALSAVAFVLALLGAEAGLRVATDEGFLRGPFSNVDWLVRDPVYLWINRPGFAGMAHVAGLSLDVPLRFDAEGLLAHGGATHVADAFRILCLGDSGTFGIWFEQAPEGGALARWRGYPGELQALLRARGDQTTQVANAGVVGHSSSHGLRQLNTRLADLDADVLVVRFGYNDHGRAWNEALAVAEPRSRVLRALLYGLHEWKLLRLALATGQRFSATGLRDRDAPWVALDEFAHNHRRFAELARARGIRLLFLDYPLRPRDWPGSPQDAQLAWMQGHREIETVYDNHARYQQALRAVAEEEGVPLVETRDVLLQGEAPGFGPGDFVHPNGVGMAAIAARVLAALDRQGWLPVATEPAGATPPRR